MRTKEMTHEEILEEVWVVGRVLGYSREAVDGMLKRASARQVLRRLQTLRRSRMAQAERQATRAWHEREGIKRTEALSQEHVAEEARLRQARAAKSLPERAAEVLICAGLGQEGTRGTAFETRTTNGSTTSPIPALHGRPLVDEVAEVLEAAVEHVERMVDEQTRCLPRRTREQRDRDILKTPGRPEVVGLRFGVSESLVRKLRTKGGLQPLNGRPMEVEQAVAA